jgi:hypothetical protein
MLSEDLKRLDAGWREGDRDAVEPAASEPTRRRRTLRQSGVNDERTSFCRHRRNTRHGGRLDTKRLGAELKAIHRSAGLDCHPAGAGGFALYVESNDGLDAAVITALVDAVAAQAARLRIHTRQTAYAGALAHRA